MKRSHAVPSEKTRGGSLGPCHLSRSEPSPGPRFAEEMKAVFLGFRLLKLCLYVPLFSSPSCLGGRHCSPLSTPPSPLIRQHRRQPVPCRLSSPRCSPWHLQAFASPGFRFSGFARPPVCPTYRPAHELGAPAPPFFTLHSPPEPRSGLGVHATLPPPNGSRRGCWFSAFRSRLWSLQTLLLPVSPSLLPTSPPFPAEDGALRAPFRL